MSNVWRFGDDARRSDAAAWVVRLEAGDLGETEAATFDAWLCASSDNGLAFDAALSVSQAYAAEGLNVAEALVRRRVVPAPTGRRAVMAMGGILSPCPNMRGPWGGNHRAQGGSEGIGVVPGKPGLLPDGGKPDLRPQLRCGLLKCLQVRDR